MPTPSPTDIPQPSESEDITPAAVDSPATMTLSKNTETEEKQAEGEAKPEQKVWTPRPNDILSPEEKDPEDLTDEELEDLTTGGISRGIFGGASAIAAAALGLVSISGTWLSTVIVQQSQLNAQVNATGKSTATQLAEGYTGPWHKMAEINGLFAVIAIVVGVAVLFAGQFLAVRPLPHWVKAVAWAGVALGVIGLFISAGMYLDWFSIHITVPPATATAPATG